MRIRKKPLLSMVSLIFLFLCWHHFFLIVSLPDKIDKILEYDFLVPLISLIGGIYCIFVILLNRKFINKYKELFRYLMVLTIFMFVLFLYSTMKYNKQLIIVTGKGVLPFLTALFTIPLLLYFEKGGKTEHLFEVINLFSIMWDFLVIAQVVYYKKYGVFWGDFWTYFKRFYNQGTYGLRISLNVFGNIMILYNLVYLRYTRKIIWKIWHLFATILGIYGLIFIQQTRAVYLYIVICVFVWIYFYSEKTIRARIIQFSGLGVVVYVLFFSNVVSKFISSFSLTGENAFSTSARIYAIKYYIDCMLKNPIFGNGIADGAANSFYSYIEHGSKGIAYYSDTGLIGLMANIGILGALIIYVIPVIFMYKSWKQNHYYLDKKNEVFLFLIIVYCIVTVPTFLIVGEANRYALLLPIFISIFESIKQKNMS